MLRLVGADLRPVPAVPYKDPNNYVKLSGRLAEELARTEPNGAIWANQFDNVANRTGHYRTTGPEIWEQTDGHGRRLHLRRRHRRHAGRRRHVPEGAQARGADRGGRPDGCGALQLVQARRAQGRGLLDQRGHRPGPDHRQPRGCAGRRRRARSPTRRPCPTSSTSSVEEGLVLGGSSGDQHRRCGPRREGAGAGPHDRDHPLRLRHPLPEQAVQPGLPAREGPARSRPGWPEQRP